MSVTHATRKILVIILLVIIIFIVWPIIGYSAELGWVVCFLPYLIFFGLTIICCSLYKFIPWCLDDLPELVRDRFGKKVNKL
ncbi:hypothetical protein CL684_02790 [Candidatus Campbellbacteria bacterium]|nr:hypothetical protein [Candidatus Campbellbacteria bacterium]